jgi:NADH:ubiquinone oxidoreductase subunit 2 (subunit N)
LFVYSFYIFNFFAFIFLISNNFLWFFTDLQYLGNFIFLISFFFSFFFGLAGIPPFLGFFAKICIVSTLLYEEQYFFFFLSLFVGLFASYFYLQTYRFSGFSVKSIYYINRVVSFKFTGFFLYLNYFLLMVNFLSIFFLSDIYLFATWIALNV